MVVLCGGSHDKENQGIGKTESPAEDHHALYGSADNLPEQADHQVSLAQAVNQDA
jgi:hypothetical protein